MTEKEEKVWLAAKKDTEFKKTLKECDGDAIPVFADAMDKVLIVSFCSLAFGFWLTECFKFTTMLKTKN
jgi:hypothetical protein